MTTGDLISGFRFSFAIVVSVRLDFVEFSLYFSQFCHTISAPHAIGYDRLYAMKRGCQRQRKAVLH